MWIARDKNSRLFLYIGSKPYKEGIEWHLTNFYDVVFELNNNLYPEVKWEDEEPRELILK